MGKQRETASQEGQSGLDSVKEMVEEMVEVMGRWWRG